MTNYDKEDYQSYKEHHICVSCRKEYAEPNRVRCWKCLEKNKKSHKNAGTNPNTKIHSAQRSRDYRASHKAMGLCIYCNKPLSKYSTCFCIEHRIKNQRKNVARKKGVERSERPELGMCYRCGKNISQGKLCDECRLQSIANLPNEVDRNSYHYKNWKSKNEAILRKGD